MYVIDVANEIPIATNSPQTLEEFDAGCSETGVTAQCCVLPIVSCLISLLYRFVK